MDNRLDRTGDDILAYTRYRLGAIYDESGGQIDIAYSDADCTVSNLPTPETNTTRCMPVIWKPPGREDPITDWFHKYVVTSVIQTDRTGLAPDMATTYDYLGGAAWHFDDDDGLTKKKNKTWSQWRGYGRVRTRTVDPSSPATPGRHLLPPRWSGIDFLWSGVWRHRRYWTRVFWRLSWRGGGGRFGQAPLQRLGWKKRY